MGRLTVAALIAKVLQGAPVGIDAYDGSSSGPQDAEVRLVLRSPRALSYLLTAPSQLGMARAYVSGALELRGAHPGDPYEALRALEDGLKELPREETTQRREFLFELARGAFEQGDLTAAVERGNELAFLDFDYRGIGQLLEEWRGSLQKA